jgi:hypothetical protein
LRFSDDEEEDGLDVSHMTRRNCQTKQTRALQLEQRAKQRVLVFNQTIRDAVVLLPPSSVMTIWKHLQRVTTRFTAVKDATLLHFWTFLRLDHYPLTSGVLSSF